MSATDLKKISERTQLWTIRNKRYAIPEDFIDRHPGGRDSILLGKGRNCTELFESYHSLTEKPLQMLDKWFVEDVRKGEADYDDQFDWEVSPFYTDLKKHVREYFLSRGLSHKATWSKLGLVSMFMVSFALIYWFGFLNGYWLSLLVLPWLYWLGPASLLHDGAHFSLSSSPTLNYLAAKMGALHMSAFAWYHQHVIGHHTKTNVYGRDPDLGAFEGDQPPGIYGHRLTPFAPYYSSYRRWLKSLFITMPFSCIQPSVKQDVNVWLFGHYDSTVGVAERPAAWRVVLHFFARALLWFTVFIVPFALFGLLKGFCFATLPTLFYGIIYYTFSQISHINENCFSGGATRDWAIHQIQTSLDWGYTNSVWLYMSISLNVQTIHHLFPQIDSSHYLALRPIVVAVAKKHGVKLNSVRTLYDALKVHFQHIRAINRDGVNGPTAPRN